MGINSIAKSSKRERTNKEKRVLVYGMTGNGCGGGIDKYLLMLSSNLEHTKLDFVIEGTHCDYLKEVNDNGGQVELVANKKTPIRNSIDNWNLLREQRTTHDVAYFNLASLNWIVPLFIAKQLGYKVYVHSHMGGAVCRDKIHRMAHYINKRLLKKMDVTRFACSSNAAKYMFGDKKVELIYNAIQAEKYAYSQEMKSQIRNDLLIEEEIVVGFVGRLEKQKNPRFLISVFERIKERIPSSKLLIIGDGTMRKELERMVIRKNLQNDCIFAGYVANVEDYLQAMDLLVLPSIHEGLPFTLVEAQTSGLQCFVSDKVTKEADISGQTVYLPIDKGPEVWRDSIIKYIENRTADRKSLVEIIRETPYDIEREASKIEILLNE